jgi:hypothetical protein
MDENERKRKRQRQIRNRKRGFSKCMIFLFAGVLAVVTVVNLILPDRKYSSQENRMLTELPRLSRDSVQSGKFMSQFESYYSDHFMARDAWITAKLQLEKLSGSRESNGVYLGKKGHLLEKPDEPDWESVQRSMNAVTAFAKEHSDQKVTFCIVPNAFSVQSQYLPKNAPVRDQADDIARVRSMAGESVQFVDLTSALKEHADEYSYYKTDHHWTTLGARYGFLALAPTLEIEPASNVFETYTVADDFQGTLSSKSGSHSSRDTVTVEQEKGDAPEYIVEYTDTGDRTATVYDRSAQKEKDKYQIFFGGNHTRINIMTTATNNRNLLVVKDSYANCLIPFLIPYYQSITVIDPRYYYDDLGTLCENAQITDVLFLYNANTFGQDQSLADMLESAGTSGASESEADAQAEDVVEADSIEGVQTESSADASLE